MSESYNDLPDPIHHNDPNTDSAALSALAQIRAGGNDLIAQSLSVMGPEVAACSAT